MNPTRHPADETLMRYAAATLDEGSCLVIGVHIAVCGECRSRVETFETIGGILLETIEPNAMAPEAFAVVLGKIDADPQSPPHRIAATGAIVPGLPVPPALRGTAIGKWRFLAPGLKFSRIDIPHAAKSNVFMLRAAPGVALPEHGHSGDEMICVLKGSFTDRGGRYAAGDIALADADILHRPCADMTGECICLVALDGTLRLRSPLGRLVQMIFGL